MIIIYNYLIPLCVIRKKKKKKKREREKEKKKKSIIFRGKEDILSGVGTNLAKKQTLNKLLIEDCFSKTHFPLQSISRLRFCFYRYMERF